MKTVKADDSSCLLVVGYFSQRSLCLTELYFSGFVQTVSVIGPIFGYLLGALCAKIYVDFGYVDMGNKTALFYVFQSKMHFLHPSHTVELIY